MTSVPKNQRLHLSLPVLSLALMSVLSELLATVKRRLAVHALATALTSNLLYMLVW